MECSCVSKKNMYMKFLFFTLFFGLLTGCQAQSTSNNTQMDSTKNYNKLTEQEQRVILQKATDRPFTGDYYLKKDEGLYICRQCNNPLYKSEDKFDSHCGWPSFDDEIEGSVKRVPDADGMRVEIICNNCEGHLGHVFIGEGFTDKDTRHCVNTSSIQFIPSADVDKIPATIK
jgi:methionine-R-sulfoxide reductase